MYLDLNKIAELYNSKPDGWQNEIAGLVTDCFDESANVVVSFSKRWQENVLFWQGEQYILYNDTINQYEVMPDNEYTSLLPRPKDNLCISPVNTMVSMLIQNKPIAYVIQNSDSSADRNRAKLAEAIETAKWDMDKEQQKYQKAAKIMTLCQNVYRKDYWDTSGLQTVKVNFKNENNEDVVIEAPLGDNAVKILTPFEIIPDLKNGIDSIDDGMFIMEHQDQPIDFIKDEYNKKGDGYTGLAEEIQPNENQSVLMTYLNELKSSDSDLMVTNDTQGKYATVIECYTRPIPTAKKGLKIVVCGGKLLYIKESLYTEADGSDWHPYTMCRYDDHPMRHYGTCLMDHIVPIQKRYNSILALQVLNRQTMAIPQWMIPNGSVMVDDYPSGMPGEIIPYDAINGQKPEKVSGRGLDVSIYKEQENCEQKIQYISGTNDVLQGQRPQGVSTATELNILLEQSMSSHAPKIQNWEMFIAKSQAKKLNLVRKMYKEPRSSLINRVKALNSDNKEVEINDYFTGQELGENIDVRIEAGSSLPKLKSAQRGSLMEAYQAKLLGDLSPEVNPEGNKKMLMELGIKKFPTSNNADLLRAEWENDLIRQGLNDDVKALPTDNQVIHFKTILDEVNRPEFIKSNKEEVVKMYNEHAMSHWDMMEDQEKMIAIGGSQKRALIVEQARNIFGLGYGMPKPPVLEERVMMLEQQVSGLSQMASEASQFVQSVIPAMRGGQLPPQQSPVDAGVAQNIPPVMA